MLIVPLLGFLIGKRNADVVEKLGLDRLGSRIRCPRCQWVPGKHDRWMCEPGCGQMWNTFETEGQCPGCGKQWAQTVCLRCRAWSQHQSWYELEPHQP